jgi:hypothetical protein
MKQLSSNQESDIVELLTQKIIDNNPTMDFDKVYAYISEDHFPPFMVELYTYIK